MPIFSNVEVICGEQYPTRSVCVYNVKDVLTRRVFSKGVSKYNCPRKQAAHADE